MPSLSLRACVLTAVLAGCASQPGSQLDGPIDYEIDDGFVGIRTVIHVELDGTATAQTTVGTDPTKLSRTTVDAATLADLRDDVAGVHLPSLAPVYSCADRVCAEDAPVVTLRIAADGTTTQIRVDLGIADRELPPGLVALVDDLEAIARTLE